MATGRSGPADLSPWPTATGAARLMLAGWRGPWVERAATEAEGWIASAMYADDDTLADGLARYRERAGGHAVVTNLQVGEDLEPAVARLQRLRELGFDEAVIFDLTPSKDRLLAVRDRFGT